MSICLRFDKNQKIYRKHPKLLKHQNFLMEMGIPKIPVKVKLSCAHRQKPFTVHTTQANFIIFCSCNSSFPFTQTLLLPAYEVRREGYVFTGVCLFTGRGITHWSLVLSGGRGSGSWSIPGVPQSGLKLGHSSQDRTVVPPRQDRGIPPKRMEVSPPTGYAAGGMPIAVTQEGLLVQIDSHLVVEQCNKPLTKNKMC